MRTAANNNVSLFLTQLPSSAIFYMEGLMGKIDEACQL